MRQRSFRFLVLAALAMVVVAIAVVSRGDREVSHAPSGQRAVPGLADKLGELAWLRLTRGPMTVNFNVIDRRWVVVEKGNYPADQDRIRKLLVQLAELELVEPKTDRPELLARLDLDDPTSGKSTEIIAQDRTGAQVARLIIGRRRPNDITGGDPGVYVRKPGSDQAWLARGVFDLSGDTLSWIDRRIIDIAPQRVASVVLTAADGSAVIVLRSAADRPFAIDGLPPDARPKDEAALSAPADALAALDLADVKPAAELAIPTDNVATASFTTFDGLIVGLRVAPPSVGDWVAIDATGFGPGEAEAKALSARLSHWSFAIPAERAKLLRTTLPDLLQPHGS
jgi:hypothetical protein